MKYRSILPGMKKFIPYAVEHGMEISAIKKDLERYPLQTREQARSDLMASTETRPSVITGIS